APEIPSPRPREPAPPLDASLAARSRRPRRGARRRGLRLDRSRDRKRAAGSRALAQRGAGPRDARDRRRGAGRTRRAALRPAGPGGDPARSAGDRRHGAQRAERRPAEGRGAPAPGRRSVFGGAVPPGGRFGSARSRDLDLRRFLIQPGACVLSHATAARLHASPGSAFPVLSGGRPRTIALAGVLDPKSASASEALDDLLICDVSTAQEVLGRLGRLSRIDLALPEGEPGRRALARIASLLPAGATLQDSAGRLREGDEMTRAFRLNLSALSLLALVCGAFLIYNTMTFSVVQRRRLIGFLRALGATRGEIFRLVLGEAAAVGAVGT